MKNLFEDYKEIKPVKENFKKKSGSLRKVDLNAEVSSGDNNGLEIKKERKNSKRLQFSVRM